MDVISGNAERLALHETTRYRAAALHARRVHAGAIGELVQRELSAYAEFGHRFASDALIPRLAAEILATASAPDARPPVPNEWVRVEGCGPGWWIRRPGTDRRTPTPQETRPCPTS